MRLLNKNSFIEFFNLGRMGSAIYRIFGSTLGQLWPLGHSHVEGGLELYILSNVGKLPHYNPMSV